MSRWPSRTLEERLLEKVTRTSGCWLWNGATDGHGYGQINIDGRPAKAHRVAYELFVGPIPEGLHIDHLCRVRLCVNPAHLEPVTSSENTHRQLAAVGHPNALKTHCPSGHPYSASNTKHHRTPTGRARACRECSNERNRRYRRRKAAHG